MERVIFYIDGYNLYNGLKRMRRIDNIWKKFYWLDFVKFFQLFIGNEQALQKVYYFSAPPLEVDQMIRQRQLFKANELLNGDLFEVIYGKFLKKPVTCPKCKYKYKVPEEKHTDVNIAIKMLDDCLMDNVDTLVLVTADGDLLTPLQLIKTRFPDKKIRVYFPPLNKSDALYNYMKSNKQKVINLENNKIKFLNSIMPDTVTKNGKSFTIPLKWKT